MIGRNRGVGVICCCVLFLAVFVGLRWYLRRTLDNTSHPEIGMLIFIVPGAIASYVSRWQRIFEPLVGAIIAIPLCAIAQHVWIEPERPFLQEMAWLFSAVFWTSLGSLGYLLWYSLRHHSKKNSRV